MAGYKEQSSGDIDTPSRLAITGQRTQHGADMNARAQPKKDAIASFKGGKVKLNQNNHIILLMNDDGTIEFLSPKGDLLSTLEQKSLALSALRMPCIPTETAKINSGAEHSTIEHLRKMASMHARVEVSDAVRGALSDYVGNLEDLQKETGLEPLFVSKLSNGFDKDGGNVSFLAELAFALNKNLKISIE